jgi:DNA helicase-2/ATP-dependent DNA helicase PcrA
VDEFQDTNRAQAELVAALAERHRNVTVVGDDDQAIYAFPRRAVANILEFEDRYRGARTVVLRRNYRSQAPILDAAYRLVRFNDPDRLEVRSGVTKRLRAERQSRGARTGPARGLRVGSRGGRLDRRRDPTAGRDRRTAARPRGAGPGQPACRPDPPCAQHRRHPVAVLRTSGLYARPEVRLLLAFLRVVADPSPASTCMRSRHPTCTGSAART